MSPAIARSRAELAVARPRLTGRVAVVMTMGALHEGHAHLIRTARETADAVVVTIFLNPLQFGAGEDLDRYPKTFDTDLALCGREGVDLVFAPTADVVYPAGDPAVRVSAGARGDRLEGEHRPGHFDGVLTVVAKLLHLTAPDLAYFGEKDAQQLALIARMVRDLDFPVEVVAVPTVREAGGLALSSRNTYLSDSDRRHARSLNRALRAGAAAAGAKTAGAGAGATLAAAGAVLADEPAVRVDYLALVDDDTWETAGVSTTKARLLVAAHVGTTRLIDNVEVTFARPADA
jgi:pantoate--beta-alanine ligase